MSLRIEQDVTEPIEVYVTTPAGLPRTGLAPGDIVIKIQRKSDSFWLDFFDLTFKAKGVVVDIDADLTEDDAVDNPGIYELVGGLDFSVITGLGIDDNLDVIAAQTAGAPSRVPPPLEVKVGQWVRKLVWPLWKRIRVVPLGDPIGGIPRVDLIEDPAGTVLATAPAFEDASGLQPYQDQGMNLREEFTP